MRKTMTEAITTNRIRKAVAAIKAERPAYATLLDFYEALFVAQEIMKEKFFSDPVEISQELISVKMKEGFPLVSVAEFPIPPDGPRHFLTTICRLVPQENALLSEAASRLSTAIDDGTLDASALFSHLLQTDDVSLENMAGKVAVDKAVLAFFAYHSIRPFLLECSEKLSGYLEGQAPWEKGYCPVCGSVPALSIINEQGKRLLSCSVCGHEWVSPRLFCPFCENKEQKSLHYFFSEEEKGYRVDMCDKCRKYIKTLDLREIKHPVYPFLEYVSTLHLDMKAQEQGLESGLPLWLQT